MAHFAELNENNIVIYGGSAPCEHLPIILEMFPKLKIQIIFDRHTQVCPILYRDSHDRVGLFRTRNIGFYQAFFCKYCSIK
jgi:hypothetical protein